MTAPPTGPPDDPPDEADDAAAGEQAAEEAGRLLAAVADWARRALPAPPSGHPGPECQWCPLCQLASVLRGEHPEITDRMAEAGAAITSAVRALVDSAGPDRAGAQPGDPAAARPTRPTRPRPRPPRVQHIDLTDAAGTAGDEDEKGSR